MSEASVTRSERILNKIGASLGITEAGKEWLKCCVDPFHDTPLNVCGYPDTNEAASIVQVVRCSTNIAVNAGVTAGANWDCHIHSFPHLDDVGWFKGLTSETQWSANAQFGSVVASGSAGASAWGGLSVCIVPSGNATYDSGAGSFAAPTAPLHNQLAPYITGGNYRIIGFGYEVINTTSDLNIQGLVTVYRQPAPAADTASTVGFSLLAQGQTPPLLQYGIASAVFDSQPPLNSGTALLLDGSKQWKAKEGVYITNTLNTDVIATGIRNQARVTILNPSDTQISASVNCIFQGITSAGTITFPSASPVGAINPYVPFSLLPTDFNASGAYFTGLSYSTTLTLNAIYYIEKFPSQNDSQLVVLAKHSCRSDRVARELYSEIMREMPVGVPQRMNGLGDWFADAISSAADFVAPVLSAIPLPMTQALGMGIKTAGNFAKSLGSKKEAPSVYSATGANTGSGGNNPIAKAVAKVKDKKNVGKAVVAAMKKK